MIVAHLIGGNEIKGITKGIVFVNDEQLETSYEDLASVCGNIPLDELDTNIDMRRTEEHIQNDYIKLVQDFNDELDDDFVVKNHLTAFVSYSEYEVDFEKKTLVLRINAD